MREMFSGDLLYLRKISPSVEETLTSITFLETISSQTYLL